MPPLGSAEASIATIVHTNNDLANIDDNDFTDVGGNNAPPPVNDAVSRAVRDAIRSAIAENSVELSNSMRRGVVAGVDDVIARMRVQMENELKADSSSGSILYSWMSLFFDPIRAALEKLVGAGAVTSTPAAAAATTAVDSREQQPVSPPRSPRAPVPVYFVTWDRRDGIKPERERALVQADNDARTSGSQPAVVVCWSQAAPSQADQVRLRSRLTALQLFFVSTDEMCGNTSTSAISHGFYELNEWLARRGLPRLDHD